MKHFFCLALLLTTISSAFAYNSTTYKLPSGEKVARQITRRGRKPTTKKTRVSKEDLLRGSDTASKYSGKTAYYPGGVDRKEENEAPVVAQIAAKDGAKIRILAVSIEYAIYEIESEGFKPNEALTFVLESSGEVLSHPIKADKDGKLMPICMLPAVIGKRGGVFHITMLRKSSTLCLKCPWGKAARKVLAKREKKRPIRL